MKTPLIISGWVYLGICLVGAAFSWASSEPAPAPQLLQADRVGAAAVGSQDCRTCHAAVYEAWQTSDHAHANRDLGRADIAAFVTSNHPAEMSVSYTEGEARITLETEDGPRTFAPEHVLGRQPLRQMLLPWDDGGLQVTQLAWDPEELEWFDVFADGRKAGEWGSWTGRGMNWNSSCAYCHMTDFQKNYDAESDTFGSSWAEQGVGCIQCHQPQLSEPPADRTAHCAGLPQEEQVMDNCAACHSRRDDFDGQFRAGDHYAEHYGLQLPVSGNLYYADGQIRDEVFVWASFRHSTMGHAGIRCADCHDPHTNQPILSFENNLLCMRCHTPPGIDGAPPIKPTEHSFHAEGSLGNRCVECHMPQTTYMRRDPRRDHGFWNPDPLLTHELGIPNACAKCHQGLEYDNLGQVINRRVPEGVPELDDEALRVAAQEWWGEDMNAAARARARAIAPVFSGEATSPEALLAELGKAENPYWMATYLELLLPWAAVEDVQREVQRLAAHPEPIVRAKVAMLAGQGNAEELLRGFQRDPVRSVRIAAARARPDLLEPGSALDAEWTRYLDYHSDQPAGALARGQYAQLRGDYPEAVRWLRRAIGYDPHSSGLRHSLALGLSASGNTSDALPQLRKAMELEPANAVFPYHAGLALAELGELVEAGAMFRKATELNPGFARAWYNLGLLAAQLGDVESAIADLRKAEAADPGNADYPYARATLHLRQRQSREAAEALQRALVNDPQHGPTRALIQRLRQRAP